MAPPRPNRLGHVLWVATHHPGEWIVWPDVNSGTAYSSLMRAIDQLPGWRLDRCVRNSYKTGSNGKTTNGDVYFKLTPPS